MGNDLFNPADYGWSLNGSGAVNKQALLDTLTAANGKSVLIPTGEWEIDHSITFNGPISLVGMDALSTTVWVKGVGDLFRHDLKYGYFSAKNFSVSYQDSNGISTFFNIRHLQPFIDATHWNRNFILDSVRCINRNVERRGCCVNLAVQQDVFIFFAKVMNCWFQDADQAININARPDGNFGSINGVSILNNVFNECLCDVESSGKVHTLTAVNNHHQCTTVANGFKGCYKLSGRYGTFINNKEHDLDWANGGRSYIFKSDALMNNVIGSLHTKNQACLDYNNSSTNTWYCNSNI